jgi:endonuclease G
MKKIASLFLFMFVFIIQISAQEIIKGIEKKDLPIFETEEEREFVVHTGYVLSYREAYEQAEYVLYTIITNDTIKIERSNNFKEDPTVSTRSASPKDYTKSGYDKGHLAPAADFSYSKVLMNESFYMSNMSPQTPNLNRGAWRLLEEYFRNLSKEFDKNYIITGPVLGKDSDSYMYKEIGSNKVKVPESYYKCGIFIKDDEIYTLAFILPNEIEGTDYTIYQCTIDDVETIINMNIFPELDEEYESIINELIK